MKAYQRALAGAGAGACATVALTGLRGSWKRVGLVFDTAPQQVVNRLEELGLIDDWPPGARRALSWAAHFAYGGGTGVVFGLLRRSTASAASEAATGSALGVLAWGVGWSSWLPLAGVHQAPWSQDTPKVLLPVLDHAAFGAAWGLAYRALSRRHEGDGG